jgi:hypothetical protein
MFLLNEWLSSSQRPKYKVVTRRSSCERILDSCNLTAAYNSTQTPIAFRGLSSKKSQALSQTSLKYIYNLNHLLTYVLELNLRLHSPSTLKKKSINDMM